VATAPPRAADASPNAFHRLLRSANRRNPPPHEDGIHDPSIEEVYMLQPPLTGLAGLPSSAAGNRIDWVKALNQGKITPRFDRLDPQVQAAVMDLNIVREVKGSMPDVVYPHKQHTQWLDCANCHPAIFKPQKGANAMSMASIMLGEQCGVCHGKVAFPVSECRLCHSKNKVAGATTAAPR
jgi:c(7)-type cytochrome triheme protein